MTRRLLPALLGAWCACSTAGPGGGGTSDAAGNVAEDAGATDANVPGIRHCGSDVCAPSEVCIRTPDASACASRCHADAGCASTQACVPLTDGGSRVCVTAGGVGDPCGPGACLETLVCAFLDDAGSRCRYPCGDPPDGGDTVACPSGWECFPFPDASSGACLPR